VARKSAGARLAINRKAPPFNAYTAIRRLSPTRRGDASPEFARHQLYAAQGRTNPVGALIKVTTKPGPAFEGGLQNEIDTLTTINRELPDSRSFPLVFDHGRLRDGRLYLVMSLFDEFPLATVVGTERVPGRLVSHLLVAMEVARALETIHRLDIFHVDLNPMNILYRAERGRPIIRIVDFESSYEAARHTAGEFYSPPTTPGYSAPEVSHQTPDARSDIYSLGAVLYALLAGDLWGSGNLLSRVEADDGLDAELQQILCTAAASDPGGRYESMTAFRAAMAAYLEQIWPGRSW